MSVRPAASSLPTPAEMERLVTQAGLSLNAGQMADLALGWRQIVGLVARIPRNRPLLDDQAYVFRLQPPSDTAKPKAVKRPARAGKAAPAKVGTKARPATAKAKSGPAAKGKRA